MVLGFAIVARRADAKDLISGVVIWFTNESRAILASICTVDEGTLRASLSPEMMVERFRESNCGASRLIEPAVSRARFDFPLGFFKIL